MWLFGPTRSDRSRHHDGPSLPRPPPTRCRTPATTSCIGPTNARQLTFDAGPNGGGHGHYDLLSFELFGYGRPLISDPGLYTYDSDRRDWAISTPAHNTISVDGLDRAALEGVDNGPFMES